MSLNQPDSFISFSSEEGKKLFVQTATSEKNYVNSYFKLSQHFISQINGAFCGVASMVTVLNSLDSTKNSRPKYSGLQNYCYYDQTNFFNEETDKIHPSAMISKRGMTFTELESLLLCHKGVQTKSYLGMNLSLSEFRSTMKQNLLLNDHFVILYYDRKIVDQEGSAHISLLAGYNEDKDMLLLMDVARFKYEVAWVNTEDIFKSINYKNTLVNMVGYDGGIIVVSENKENTIQQKPKLGAMNPFKFLMIAVIFIYVLGLISGLFVGKFFRAK
eukprot:gene10833-3453_t